MAGSQYRCFAAVSPGLEDLLVAELRSLGVSATRRAGGAEFSGTRETLWRVHHWSRLAESVRVRLKSFKAFSFIALEAELDKLAWHAYLRPDTPLRVDVTCHKSRLYHSDAVAQRVAGVIGRRLGSLPEDGRARQRVFARLDRDRVQISVDATGELLHRRGYRQHVSEAPLRETLAAALVRRFEQPGSPSVVWDPCCGAGTLLIEWVDARVNGAPGRGRRFAFEAWPTHDAQAYGRWRAEQPEPESSAGLAAFGSDRSARALEAAAHNVERAGYTAACRLQQGDLSAVADHIPMGAGVLTNPPFGKRLPKGASRRVLAALDALLSRRRDLRPALVLCTDRHFAARSRLVWREVLAFSSGGLTVSALLLES